MSMGRAGCAMRMRSCGRGFRGIWSALWQAHSLQTREYTRVERKAPYEELLEIRIAHRRGSRHFGLAGGGRYQRYQDVLQDCLRTKAVGQSGTREAAARGWRYRSQLHRAAGRERVVHAGPG